MQEGQREWGGGGGEATVTVTAAMATCFGGRDGVLRMCCDIVTPETSLSPEDRYNQVVAKT